MGVPRHRIPSLITRHMGRCWQHRVNRRCQSAHFMLTTLSLLADSLAGLQHLIAAAEAFCGAVGMIICVDIVFSAHQVP